MVTVIVPTYNERERIVALQNELDALEGTFEVWISDGFSSDGTVERIRYPMIQEAQGRAAQMNQAAKRARGDYLWFVHCDSRLDPRSIEAIESSGLDVGCFSLRFDSRDPFMRIVGFMSRLRVRVRGIAFGDQGIFVRQALFEQLGGFADLPIMEDYEFSLRCSRMGKRVRALSLPLYTSARRFEQRGKLRTCWLMQKLQHQFRKGRKIEEIYEQYR